MYLLNIIYDYLTHSFPGDAEILVNMLPTALDNFLAKELDILYTLEIDNIVEPMITESQLNILHRQIRPLMNAIKETFPNKSGQKVGPGKAWNFPKFHKLCELAYSIHKWGMLLNTSCQTGERAHTALTKKSYLKTNFKNSNKQMLERYLRRVGSLRRAEYAAKYIELNRDTSRLRWDSLDPRWRTRRQLKENKSARVQ